MGRRRGLVRGVSSVRRSNPVRGRRSSCFPTRNCSRSASRSGTVAERSHTTSAACVVHRCHEVRSWLLRVFSWRCTGRSSASLDVPFIRWAVPSLGRPARPVPHIRMGISVRFRSSRRRYSKTAIRGEAAQLLRGAPSIARHNAEDACATAQDAYVVHRYHAVPYLLTS